MARKKKQLVRTCKYCEFFRTSKKRYGVDTEGGNIDRRLCDETKQKVCDFDLVCDEFVGVKLFYCVGGHKWLVPVVCLQRRLRGKYGCKSCNQGKEVSLFLIDRERSNSRKGETKG